MSGERGEKLRKRALNQATANLKSCVGGCSQTSQKLGRDHDTLGKDKKLLKYHVGNNIQNI